MIPSLLAIWLSLAAPVISPPSPASVGEEHVDYWVRTLQNPLQLVRKNAARMLGTIGDRRATDPLVSALKDPYFGVRTEAARSLGLLGDERAISALSGSRERDTDPRVRRTAGEAIERIKAYVEFQKKKAETKKH